MYKDLVVWKESVGLIKDVYMAAECFPRSEEYVLKQQLKRAVISVSLNIAEGKSRKTGKDFANFLSIAQGSLSEVDAVLSISQELGYFEYNNNLRNRIEVLSKKINKLRTTIIGRRKQYG